MLGNYDRTKDCVYSAAYYTDTPGFYTPEVPNYFGSGSYDIARANVLDITNWPGSGTMGEYDLSNMLTRPSAEAHGIVWKVVVNGYDAQDDADIMPALGVGRHKFEVYFNRPMNKAVEPMIAMGVRAPYTQTAIAEDGAWNDEGDRYTAWLTISGRSSFDGVNRLYVAGAEDNEFFEIPVENMRFNVNVQAAGSLSEGFTAQAGLGRVKLEWENPEENFDDMLGYNMYRYTVDDAGTASEPVRINERLIEAADTRLSDFEVTPGETYCYYYKVMRTNMTENSASKTVAATPLTSVAGDANASGAVNVSDVITTVNYAAGMNPKPFLFEAADMNRDGSIDILDVVGIIRAIMNPGAAASASVQSTATWYVENGTLYIDTPVELAGVQLCIAGTDGAGVTPGEALEGFEINTWTNSEGYNLMAYSFSGKRIAAGRHALLSLGAGAEVKSIVLSDVDGTDVDAINGNPTTGITLPCGTVVAGRGVYTVAGIRLGDDASALNRLPAGVYIDDGVKIVKK